MRRIRQLTLVLPMVMAVMLLRPASADAITLQEIIEMTHAGLGEEVLLALIDVDQRVFPIDKATLTMLKQEGVSERVIVAMVKSGRSAQPAPDPVQVTPVEPPEPEVVYVDRPVVQVQEVPVAVPVYIAVGSGHSRYRNNGVSVDESYTSPRTPFNPFGPLPGTQPVQQHKPAEPVYWGWGGKLRPDAWQPSPNERGGRGHESGNEKGNAKGNDKSDQSSKAKGRP